MSQVRMLACLAPVALVVSAPAGLTQEGRAQQVAGSAVYKTYCVVCHGPAGKGDGPLADSLRFRPPDLTLLAKKNGGAFPKGRVLRTVDGRKPVKGHGGPDMPVWGDAFKQSQDGYGEAAVQAKIEAVVAHVETLQER